MKNPGGILATGCARMKMLILGTVIFMFIACGGDNPVAGNDEMGTLEFYMTVWNAYNSDDASADHSTTRGTYTCDLIDIRHLIPLIQATTDVVAEGVAYSSIEWVTIYESDVEMLHTDREITIDIPVGDYKCLRLLTRHHFYWVCTYDDEVHEFYILEGEPPDAYQEQIINEDGIYKVDSQGNFYLHHSGEKLGTFEILQDMHTSVTMRLNIQTIDWFDLDDDGVWSAGDSTGNETLPNGIDTMTDFIVEYN